MFNYVLKPHFSGCVALVGLCSPRRNQLGEALVKCFAPPLWSQGDVQPVLYPGLIIVLYSAGHGDWPSDGQAEEAGLIRVLHDNCYMETGREKVSSLFRFQAVRVYRLGLMFDVFSATWRKCIILLNWNSKDIYHLIWPEAWKQAVLELNNSMMS